jgi:hypothetical protein
MHILDIGLYGEGDRTRRISLRPNQLNIITGASKTGKSALSNIVEYCLGRDSFLVPAGIIADNVRWYALRLQFPSTQVFVARAAPARGERTSSAVHLSLGAEVSIPPASELAKNSNTKDMRDKLTRLLRIAPNLNIPDDDESRLPLEATIAHALFLNFQQQGEVANQFLLFHRQGEDRIPQTIKDTLPYFLGAVPEDRLAKVQELRRERRALVLAARRQKEAESLRGDGISKGLALLAEAEEEGLVSVAERPTTIESLRQVLLSVLNWSPTEIPAVPGDALAPLQDERTALVAEYRRIKDRLRAAKNCAQGQAKFATEAREQRTRLLSVGLFGEPNSDGATCPICQSALEMPPPAASDMQASLQRITAQLNSVDSESPRLREHIDRMEEQLQEASRRLDQNRAAMNALTAQQPDMGSIVASNTRIAMVLGRVGYYLENLPTAEQPSPLDEDVLRAKRRVDELEEELANSSAEELLPSILSNIGQRIERYGEQLDFEFSTSALRLDLTRLTVIADTDSGPVPLARMGSGANWLACHLATHAALHDWFIRQDRPVPRFLFLDQPSRAYYPPDRDATSLRAALEQDDGSLAFLRDDDRQAVRQVFRWLHDLPGVLGGFQIIVTDHADIPEEWFTNCVVARWRGDEKLIPADWLE